MIQEMRQIAEDLPVPPTSVIIFGSFARGEADADSDIDTLLVRPSGTSESDEAWSACVQQWLDRVSDVSGNRVEVLEVDQNDVPARLDRGGSVWQDIERDGLIIHGASLDSFRSVIGG
jgi:predicted nucleotidyltransferase